MPIRLPDEDTAGGGQQPSTRKPLSRSEAARHASLVRWGKEQPFAARLAAIRQARKKGGRKRTKGRATAKPKLTPEQRAAEKEAQRKANMAALGKELDDADNPAMSSRGLAALEAARNGEEPTGAMADGLIKGGFAERGADGRFRLTSEGRALMRAADRGDKEGALDAISRASDRATRNAEKEQKKGKGGGGGGKGKKEPPDKAAEKRQKASEAAARVGLKPDDVEALRKAAEDGGSRSAMLERLGLIANGETTDQGRRALAALERGDVRGYRAAVQDARSRAGRAAPPQQKKRTTAVDSQLVRRKGLVERRAARAEFFAGKDAAVKRDRGEAETRAMFAAMGSSGGSGSASGGGGKGPSLWNKNPKTGKREPGMGLEHENLFGPSYQARQAQLRANGGIEARLARGKPTREQFFHEQTANIGTQAQPKIVKQSLPPLNTGAAHTGDESKPERYRELEAATQRVRMPQAGWNQAASEKQQGYLGSLLDRARLNTKENSPQRELADELSRLAKSGKLTKWEASQFIDAMREPRPLSTLLQRARDGILNGGREDAAWRALLASPRFRQDLINHALAERAKEEGLPF